METKQLKINMRNPARSKVFIQKPYQTPCQLAFLMALHRECVAGRGHDGGRVVSLEGGEVK